MDTNKLIHFRTIFQTRNLREAATLLNISHAGLSKSIKTLEEELGTELITKDGRGIRITDSGKELIQYIEAVLTTVDQLRNKSNQVEMLTRKNCRIGTFEVFSTYLASCIKDSLNPGTNLSLIELLPGDIEKALVQGKIDYGISYIPIPSPRLDHLKVSSIKMGVFGKDKFQNVSFKNLPFVIPVSDIEGTPTKAKGLDGWPDHGLPRNVEYTVSLMESALSLTRKGHAVGYFPKFIVERHNDIVVKKYQLQEIEIPKKLKITQDVYLIKRKESKESAVVKRITKLLRSLE